MKNKNDFILVTYIIHNNIDNIVEYLINITPLTPLCLEDDNIQHRVNISVIFAF